MNTAPTSIGPNPQFSTLFSALYGGDKNDSCDKRKYRFFMLEC